MEWFSNTLQDIRESMSAPLKADMPLSSVLLIFVLFLVVAFIVFDTLRIVSSWIAENAST